MRRASLLLCVSPLVLGAPTPSSRRAQSTALAAEPAALPAASAGRNSTLAEILAAAREAVAQAEIAGEKALPARAVALVGQAPGDDPEEAMAASEGE